jgi:uncharacterized repeat protein (TIGR01451 family)
VKQFLKIFVTLGLTGLFVLSLAQTNTTAGTTITNTATATFTDSNGQPRSSTSNTVTTTVQTVYSFNIEPDDALSPTATTNFALYSETDGLNNVTATDATNTTFATGVTGDVAFSYVVTNNTNNTAAANQIVTIQVNALQDTTDNYNFTNIRAYTYTDTNSNDRWDSGEALSGSTIFTGTGTANLTFTAQGQATKVVIFADIPNTATGNQVARLDLVGTNLGNTLGGAPTAGANVSYETNNIARAAVTELPQVALAKNLDSVTNVGDGTYNVQYTFNIANLGNVALSSVQITDTLPFTPAANITIVSAALSNATGGLTANASYNGTTTVTMLSGSNTLAIAGTGSIRLNVVVRPLTNAGLTTYNNTATATAESPNNPVPAGADTSDISDSGTDVRGTGGDGDTNPGEANENDPTATLLAENPQIGVAKQAGTVTSAGDGDFTVPFTLTLENLGNVNLHDVQITESLADFGTYVATVAGVDTAGEYTISVAPNITDATATPAFTANSAFTGAGANTGIFNLSAALATSPVLEVGQTITVAFTVRFYPNLANSPFFNQVTASGDVPRNFNGTATGNTTDLSDNGSDPDPDGDGIANEQATAYDANNSNNSGTPSPATEGVVTEPTGDSLGNDVTNDNNDPTLVTLTTNARIGAAKQVTPVPGVTDNGNGTFTVPFTMTIENLGDVDLYDVQVTDSLTAEFGTYQALLANVDSAGEYTVGTVSVTDTTPGTALAANTGYTGSGVNTGLLTVSSAAALEVGRSVTMTFSLTFYPNFANSPFTNQATASGDRPDAGGDGDGIADGNTTDTSTSGTDPDPGGDGDPGPDTTPTPVPVTSTPRIGAAKSAGTLTSNNDGTFTVPFTMTIQNYGNVDLYDVQVTDILSAEFGTYETTVAAVNVAGEYTVGAVSVTDTTPGTALAENTGFTGTTPNTGLLTVSSAAALEVGRSVTMTFNLTFYPNMANATVTGTNAVFQNQVTASGDAPDAQGDGNGTADGGTTDTSDSGTNPDTDGDKIPNEAGENDPTDITIAMTPVIGVAKSAGTVTDNNDGTFSVPFTLNVRNYGNVDAHDVQIVEDLATEFGTFQATAATVNASGRYTVSGLSITTNAANALTANAIGSSAGQFNGSGTNTSLLNVTSGGHIRPSETVTLTFTLRFFPNFSNATFSGSNATFQNQVTARADNPNNNDNTTTGDTTDTSDSGTNPDTDNDKIPNEAGENDPTDVVVTMRPAIGTAKTATVTGTDTDGNATTPGPFEITFNFYLENLGNTNLTAVTLTDTLSGAQPQFGTLNSNATLDPGEYEIVSRTKVSGPATITENTAFTGTGVNTGLITTGSLLVGETAQIRVVIRVNGSGAYTNQTTANANGPGTTTTTDTSDNGTDPDPDGDNNPNETGENDVTPVNLDALTLAKTQRICDDANCVGEVTTPVSSNLTINPNNYIEYTIVATNSGSQPLTLVMVRDAIPVPTQLAFSSRTTAGMECTTDAAGLTGFATANCPTSGTSTTVTYVRLAPASVAASGTTTLRFVVYVP